MGAGWTWNRSPKNAIFSAESACILSGRLYNRSMNNKKAFTVYFMLDIDAPEVLFTGTWDECEAFIEKDRHSHGRNILRKFYAIQ